MKAAPKPQDETKRIQSLKSYEILDTAAEEQFNELVELASYICGTPISLVTFIDTERQWVKAKVGIDAKETSREVAFCSHTILTDEIFIVKDARADERFFDNPFVTGEANIQFYAGAPLIDKEGHRLGALCVIDQKPRDLSQEQLSALKKLSKMVVAHLELRLELKKQKEQEEFLKKQTMMMIQSAKMSTLGEMASGIAHEINNPLTIIQGTIHLVKKMIAGPDYNPDMVLEKLDRVETTTVRISKIIKGLLHFSRDTVDSKLEQVRLKDIINDTIDMCSERLRLNDIELRLELKTDVMIECKPIQISQALLNLINNSYDAILGSNEAWIKISLDNEGEKILLSVTDSGQGIREDIVDKVLQPFFTTKEPGKGTGLGLSISKGLIETHGGDLYYDKNSKNTKFSIRLPIVKICS